MCVLETEKKAETASVSEKKHSFFHLRRRKTASTEKDNEIEGESIDNKGEEEGMFSVAPIHRFLFIYFFVCLQLNVTV